MAIVAGFDVHRAQITFDALDTESGKVSRGRIDATPAAVARWSGRFQGREVHGRVRVASGLTANPRRCLLRLGRGDLDIDVGEAARRRCEHFVGLAAEKVWAR
jgi:hypothetical protein